MIVFYTEEFDEKSIVLRDDEFKHCVKVLRNKVGDQINVFNEEGVLLEVQIQEITPRYLLGKILKAQPEKQKNHHFCLAIAPTKKPDRLEWMVAKSIEIGVQEIWLIKTHRTENPRYKLERLRRIAFSAAKQSLNFKLPIFKTFDSLQLAFSDLESFDHRYIAHCENPDEHLLKKDIATPNKTIILIGPEGDFTKDEIQLSKENGFIEVSLGNSRLRTETAGIVALTLLNAAIVTS